MVEMRHIGRAIDVERVKDEIRKLNRADKNEICKWIDQEAAIGLLFRVAKQSNRSAERPAKMAEDSNGPGQGTESLSR